MMMLFGHIHLWMFADKLHIFVECLNAGHIRLSIVCKLYLVATADTLCAPVEISHIYRTSYLTCNCVEACLPSFDCLASSFRCESEMNDILALHLLDDAEGNVAASFSVNRNASKLTEKPSERAPEHFALDHTVRFATYRGII